MVGMKRSIGNQLNRPLLYAISEPTPILILTVAFNRAATHGILTLEVLPESHDIYVQGIPSIGKMI